MEDSHEPASNQRPDTQFSISFWFFVTAGFAVCFVVLRSVVTMQTVSPAGKWALGIYAVLLTTYLLLRVPLLLRRTSRRLAVVRGNRRRILVEVRALEESQRDVEASSDDGISSGSGPGSA